MKNIIVLSTLLFSFFFASYAQNSSTSEDPNVYYRARVEGAKGGDSKPSLDPEFTEACKTVWDVTTFLPREFARAADGLWKPRERAAQLYDKSKELGSKVVEKGEEIIDFIENR